MRSWFRYTGPTLKIASVGECYGNFRSKRSGATLMTAMAVMSLFGCRHHSNDAELIAHFQRHREEFSRLAEMGKADPTLRYQSCVLDYPDGK
jgi:hypothetical protein